MIFLGDLTFQINSKFWIFTWNFAHINLPTKFQTFWTKHSWDRSLLLMDKIWAQKIVSTSRGSLFRYDWSLALRYPIMLKLRSLCLTRKAKRMGYMLWIFFDQTLYIPVDIQSGTQINLVWAIYSTIHLWNLYLNTEIE